MDERMMRPEEIKEVQDLREKAKLLTKERQMTKNEA